MPSVEENELLTRVGPGTVMGNLLREYWTPVLLTTELEPGKRVKRVRLMGEDLVAFRTESGRVGLMGEFCSHRRTSLYFGRIEESCLRCPYHGWAYALDGQCIDQPNQPSGTGFAEKVWHPAYPCEERGGVIWTYMGTSRQPPPLPDLEWTMVPDGQRYVSKFYTECNYLQAMEGGVDPAHIAFLHAPLDTAESDVMQKLRKAEAGFGFALTLEKAPRVETADTDYGLLIAAGRTAPDDMDYWRITQFHMPLHTMPPTENNIDPIYQSHIWVPVDDENMVNWCISWNATRPLAEEEIDSMRKGLGIHILDYEPATNEAYGDIRLRSNRENDYYMDWEAHRTRMFFGVPGVGAQDRAIQEAQGAIYDLSQETLGTSDIGIVRVRRRLMGAALALREDGTPPPGLDSASYFIRPASVLLPKEAQWAEEAKKQLVATY